jgi:hypothetical protein
MTKHEPFSASSAWTQAGWRRDLVALGLVGVAYALVFFIARDPGPAELLILIVRNLVPFAVCALAARATLEDYVLSWSGWRQVAGHLALAALFSLSWLWLLTILAGLFSGEGPTNFRVAPLLLGEAQAWQLLQGTALYAVVALLTALDVRPPATGLVLLDDLGDAKATRFLVREGEEVVPVAVSSIVSITGADDYSELVTTAGNRLVQTRLAAFEQLLDPVRFIRAHRSAIVNLDHLERADPAGGGRLTLHMAAGPAVPASRAGARLLRERLL